MPGANLQFDFLGHRFGVEEALEPRLVEIDRRAARARIRAAAAALPGRLPQPAAQGQRRLRLRLPSPALPADAAHRGGGGGRDQDDDDRQPGAHPDDPLADVADRRATRSPTCSGSPSCWRPLQEPALRVRAFRGAAATLAELGAERGRAPRRDRRAAGAVRDRRGHRAHDPREPARRGAGLPAPPRVDGGQPLAEGAAALRAGAARRLHAHTIASDGGSTIREMAEAAIELGHEYLVITDHSPRLTVANGLSPSGCRRSSTRSPRSTRSLRRSGSSPGSRSTSTRTARSTRRPSSSSRSTSWSAASTRSCGWRSGR